MFFSPFPQQLSTNMAVDRQTTTKTPHPATAFHYQTRRRIFFPRMRRRNKLPAVRLGGKKPRRGIFVMKVLKKMRLRWLKLQYTCMLRKMKKYYRDLIKDLLEAGSCSTVEAFQQRMFMESTFAVPVMGVTFANFTGSSDRPRPLFF